MAWIMLKTNVSANPRAQTQTDIGDAWMTETEERGEFRAESFADIIDEMAIRGDSFAAQTITNFAKFGS